MRIIRLSLLSSLLVIACGLISFDVDQPIPEQTVQGSPLGPLLPAGLFSIPLQIDLDASTRAHGTGAATSATLKSMTLTVTSPADETFAFLESISLGIGAPGQPDQQIASLSPVPAQGTISLQPTPGVNLLPYIKSGATITATASGHLPARDIKFNGKLVVTIKI